MKTYSRINKNTLRTLTDGCTIRAALMPAASKINKYIKNINTPTGYAYYLATDTTYQTVINNKVFVNDKLIMQEVLNKFGRENVIKNPFRHSTIFVRKENSTYHDRASHNTILLFIYLGFLINDMETGVIENLSVSYLKKQLNISYPCIKNSLKWLYNHNLIEVDDPLFYDIFNVKLLSCNNHDLYKPAQQGGNGFVCFTLELFEKIRKLNMGALRTFLKYFDLVNSKTEQASISEREFKAALPLYFRTLTLDKYLKQLSDAGLVSFAKSHERAEKIITFSAGKYFGNSYMKNKKESVHNTAVQLYSSLFTIYDFSVDIKQNEIKASFNGHEMTIRNEQIENLKQSISEFTSDTFTKIKNYLLNIANSTKEITRYELSRMQDKEPSDIIDKPLINAMKNSVFIKIHNLASYLNTLGHVQDLTKVDFYNVEF